MPAEAMSNRNTNSMCVKLPVHKNFATLIILLSCSQYAACIQVESEMDIHGYKQCYSIRRQFLCSQWTSHFLPVCERVKQETYGSCQISHYCTYHVVTQIYQVGGAVIVQYSMLIFKVALSLFCNVNQSACSTHDRVLDSRSQFY